MIKVVIILGIIVGVWAQTTSAQTQPAKRVVIEPITIPYTFPEIHIALGLTTSWLNGANPAGATIFPKDTINTIGGGFIGQQPGIAVRGLFIMDSARRFRVTAGLDYIWYTGPQRLEGAGYTFTARHTIDVPTAVLGFEYAFLKLPLANAKIYGGIEARYAFVSDGTFRRKVVYKLVDKIQDETFSTKTDVQRLGAALRLGIEGELLDPVYVNISGAYGAVNLLGREDTRGELLTPTNLAEKQENILGNIFFTMMVQFRL